MESKGPKDLIRKLTNAAMDALGDPAVRQRLEDLGQLGAYHKVEIEKWWPIIKAAGIRAE